MSTRSCDSATGQPRCQVPCLSCARTGAGSGSVAVWNGAPASSASGRTKMRAASDASESSSSGATIPAYRRPMRRVGRSQRLLGQAGGFDGVVAVLVLEQVDHLAVAHLEMPVEVHVDGDPAAPGRFASSVASFENRRLAGTSASTRSIVASLWRRACPQIISGLLGSKTLGAVHARASISRTRGPPGRRCDRRLTNAEVTPPAAQHSSAPIRARRWGAASERLLS